LAGANEDAADATPDSTLVSRRISAMREVGHAVLNQSAEYPDSHLPCARD
jgi:hypothetical protein